MRDLVPSDAAERIQSNDHAVFNTGRIVTYEHSMQSEDRERLLSVKKLPIWGREGNPQYVLTISEDVTEQRSAEQQIVHMARHDALTELANRALFTSRIDKAAARCRRNNGHFAVLILDLDHFKQVNDPLGHPVGDALLKLIAQRLLACTSASDTVARLGGDEFAILQVTEGDPREGAVVLASRILEAVIAPCDLDGQKVIVGASIGVAVAPEHGGAANLLMKRPTWRASKFEADGRKLSVLRTGNGSECARTPCTRNRFAGSRRRSNSKFTISPLFSLRHARRLGLKHWFAGDIRSAARSRQSTSYRLPKRPALLSRSATGYCARSAPTRLPGRLRSKLRSICRRHSSTKATSLRSWPTCLPIPGSRPSGWRWR